MWLELPQWHVAHGSAVFELRAPLSAFRHKLAQLSMQQERMQADLHCIVLHKLLPAMMPTCCQQGPLAPMRARSRCIQVGAPGAKRLQARQAAQAHRPGVAKAAVLQPGQQLGHDCWEAASPPRCWLRHPLHAPPGSVADTPLFIGSAGALSYSAT